jgi:plasmid stabilization system protein ParE
MSNDYAIVFSKDSADDLRDIGRYIEQVSGSRWVAGRQLQKIRDAVHGRASTPMRHPIASEGAASHLNLRRMNVGNYTVFYCVNEDSREILVDRIVYGIRSLGIPCPCGTRSRDTARPRSS